VAGIAALLLCVVLGNLDTPRVLGHGIASLAGYEKPQGLEHYLIEQAENQLADEQQTPQGEPPPVLPPERRTELMERAEANYLLDRLAYEVDNSTDLVSSLIAGTDRLLSGQRLLIASNRWYWAPTRVLLETPGVGGQAITEFPFFTFLYGDLHAHMISLPVMLFVMLIIFNEVAVASRDKRSTAGIALALLLGGISVGLLRGINTWDWPTFMVFGTIGLGYAWWRRWETINRASLLALLVYVGGFLITAQIAISPYVAWFASTYDSARLWDGGKTPLWAYWNIYGLFLFLVVSMMAWDTADWLRQTQVRALRGRQRWLLAAGMITAAVLLIALVLAIIEYQVALIVLPLILWIVALFFRPGQSATMQYVLVLIGLALALTLAVEFVVLAGDNGRQNTVFKFYMQVWLLLSVAGGAAFAWLVRSSDYWSLRLRLVWYTPLLLLTAIAVMYPVMSIRARSLDRMAPTDTPLTLDGLEYLRHASHYLRHSGESIETANDYHIIRWLQENVDGTPVIMEGREAASEYTYTSRISINTGLPSVLGWRYHQIQQRTLSPLSEFVVQREQNIKFAYNSPNIPETVKILRHYDVRYVIVSDAEIAQMTSEGLNKFETMVEMGLFEVVYERGEAWVYHIRQDALDNFALDSLAFQESLGLDAVPPPAGYEADPDTALQRLSAIQDTLLAYDAQFVALDDLRQVEQFSPDALQRVLELTEMNVLTLFDNYGTGRIYAVNQDRLNARATDEEN
jgi:YYY domain-containing protein